jgi:arylsulfatase A-like enzyme
MVPQLGEVFQDPRAGEIIIFAAPGWSFCRDYVGGHGGIERDEMLIPMYFAGPGLLPHGKVGTARLADLVPTVLDLMGWRASVAHPQHFDGVSIADSLKGHSR